MGIEPGELGSVHDLDGCFRNPLHLLLELREPLLHRLVDGRLLRFLLELLEPVVARQRERFDFGKPLAERFELLRLRLDDFFLLEKELAQLLDGLLRALGWRLLRSGGREGGEDQREHY